MKKYLLSEKGNYYKTNMHCHTNNSDGAFSPEEIKKMYMEKGYSAVAYTDHDILLDRSHLCDENFVALNGFEAEFDGGCPDGNFALCHTCHICMVGIKQDTLIQPFWHRSAYLFGNAVNFRDQVKFDENEPDYGRSHTPENINLAIDLYRKGGFFVTYNHPVWSIEGYEDYMNYHNFNAMEICNYTCLVDGHDEYNEKEYDDMLRGGKRIYCVGGDDSHSNLKGFFGAWTMIKAEKLEYEALTDSLVKGNFYASQGPEIYDLWVEDGKIYITCSKAKRITLKTATRHTGCVTGTKEAPATEASFNIYPWDEYARITVEDFDGLHANTNAYFTDEIFEAQEK